MSEVSTAAGVVAARASRGVATYLVRNAAIQVIQIVSAIVVARILTPENYGLIALVLSLGAVSAVLGDLGFTRKFVTDRSVDVSAEEVQMRAAMLSGLVYLALALAVGPLVISQGGTAASLMLAVVVLSQGIRSLRGTAVLRRTRSLQYGSLGMIDVLDSGVLYVTQVILLLLGTGPWAIPLANTLSAAVGTVVLTRALREWTRPKLGKLVLPGWRAAIAFQWPLAIVAGMGAFMPLLVGWQLGPDGLGYWAWATVLLTPITSFANAMYDAVMPALARLRDTAEHLSGAATERIARFTVPLTAGLAGTLGGLAPAMIQHIFGTRWEPALPAVRIAAAGLVATVLVRLLNARMSAEARTRQSTRITAISTGVTVLAIAPASHCFGLLGAAGTMYLAYPTINAALLVHEVKVSLGRVLVASSVLFGVGWGLGYGVSEAASGVGSLVLEGGLAVMIMLAASLASDGEISRYALRSLRRSEP